MAKNKPLHPKFVFRRFIVVILIVALVLFSGYFIGRGNLFKDNQSVSQPELSSSEEDSSIIDEVSAAAPEPEPEPVTDISKWQLRLVGPANPLEKDFAPPELTTITENYKVDSRIADSVRTMFSHAKLDGINLMICSAYRPVDYQQGLYDNKVGEFISQGNDSSQAAVLASAIVALPGTSEHQTGLALDIVTPDYQVLDDGFADTPAYKWLDQNAYKYGFILRFPKNKQELTKIIYEPWHWRYVGIDDAIKIKEAGYCLEEYLYVALKDSHKSSSTTQSSMDTSEPSSKN